MPIRSAADGRTERRIVSESPEVLDLLVVGAGPSGLAYALGAQAGARSQGRSLTLRVLEALPRPGGWVHTRRVGAYTLETGPYGYLDKHPELGRIVEEVGLSSLRREPTPLARNRYVLSRGKLRALPRGPLSFLFSRILSLGAKLRLLREPWAAPPPGGDESVSAFASRRLGPRAAEALVVPMFTGIYAGDPDRASLAACFPRMAELERDHGGLFRALWRLRKQVRASGQGVGAPRGVLTSFEGGLSTLIERVAAALGDGVLSLATPAHAVTREAQGFRVDSAHGPLRAKQLVLALPARQAAPLLRGSEPRLAEQLAQIPYAGVVVVHTAYSGQAARRVPPGFGFLVPRTAKREVLGAVFVSTIFPDQAPAGELLLRNVLGGMLRPDLLDLDEDELVRRVREEHRGLLGLAEEPRFVDVVRYPDSLPQYHLGHLEHVASLEAEVQKVPGLRVTGNALRGIGLADCLAQNYRKGLEDFTS